MPTLTTPETTEAIQLPRKKRSVLWWVAGLFAFLLLLFIFQLFGPNPQIVVSPRTTYITAPLRPNGLPDYEQHILQLYREGVTPQNNAAALIWQALWPGELSPNQDAVRIAAELGLTEIPAKSETLTHLFGKANISAVRTWLNEQGHDSFEAKYVNGALAADEPVEKLLNQAMMRPWTAGQVPPLGKWVAANETPLELIVEASHRRRCYFPSPSLLNRQSEPLVMMLLPGQQSSRKAAVALAARAMWHLGEGRHEIAWNDVLAIHRLARLVAQGQCLIENIIALHLSNLACRGTTAILDHADLSSEQARKILSDLDALSPNISTAATSIAGMERVSFLDLVTRAGSSDVGEMLSGTGINNSVLSYGNAVSVDWNLVLIRGNEYYDRVAAAAQLPTGAARDAALSKIDNEIQTFHAQISEPGAMMAGLVSRKERSEIVAKVMLAACLPAFEATTETEDRERILFELTKLAAALEVYRGKHADYPANLEQLVPTVLEKLPADFYNNSPFVYKRGEEGYLLYNVGSNGADDGGSNETLRILKGQPLGELDDVEAERLRTKLPTGSDDISIRVPQPAFELPKMPASAGEP